MSKGVRLKSYVDAINASDVGPLEAGNDVRNLSAGYAVLLRKLGLSLPASYVAGADLSDLSRRHLGPPISFARGARAMEASVALVFLWRRPTQIIGSIITPLAVFVGHLMTWAGAWAMERGGDGNVHVNRNIAAIDCHIDLAISTGLSDAQHPHSAPKFVGADTLYTPLARRGIVRRERDGLPDFGAIVGVSHCALLSREGQGRALLTQRFRPAFYSACAGAEQ